MKPSWVEAIRELQVEITKGNRISYSQEEWSDSKGRP